MKVIYYVKVGNLPKKKAEEYLREMEKVAREKLKLKDEDALLAVPVIDGDSRIEVLFYE